ncbi:hypothetical protein B0I35DRAFT_414849 [Stachybotrys elegans]|uniref:Uncharacterized protein n=1 Tax=Stachybotrys elegans TaxID=80388 RepID=A0A8K0WJI3_9HYPO|nr:hypothetical protein B0I35DRAFT_414849 [Stachybotrys elegans]
MRSLVLVFTALFGCVAAVDQCTKATSGSCSPGKTPPTCDGPLNSNGDVMKPVCTKIVTIPQGSFHGTLYCGNPLANTGSGTQKGTIDVTIGQCQTTTGFCFILTATAPSGSNLQADYKVQISTSPITRDNPGGFDTKVTSQPVYVPFSLVYGSKNPCTDGPKYAYIAFHAQTNSQTCWGGINSSPPYSDLQTIPGGNKNWALQFKFPFTCKDYCCPDVYINSCPGKCSPTTPDWCNLKHVPNPDGWSSNPDYAQQWPVQYGGGTCGTETAFGVPSGCTSDLCDTTTLQSKGCGRWGWYLENVGKDSGGNPGPYKLHEGAGQNKLSNGVDVGFVMVQSCPSDSSKTCAFFTTTGGWRITTAHVQANCGALSGTGNNFPCAPGQYNLNGGGSCGSPGLPGTLW